MIGIYSINNIIDNKYYIGETKNLIKRLDEHLRMLKNNKHPNDHLQNAFNLYGKQSFSFEILEECPIEYLKSQENYWCNMLNTHNRKYGYNIQSTSPVGKTNMSKETIEKIRIANKGRKFCLGKHHSDETKKKISNSNKGKIMNEEFRKKCRSRMLGNKFSDISKIKLSISVSKAKKGIKLTDKHKLSLSISHKKPIIQLDLNGNFIKNWESSSDTAKYGFNPGNITQCCKGKISSSKGFKWKYKDNG